MVLRPGRKTTIMRSFYAAQSGKMIHPLQLGNLSLPSNLIQAPLAGVSCAPFRELIAEFAGVAYCATEMISAKTLLHRPLRRYTYKSPREGLLSFQLSGNQVLELQKAAELACGYGADLIDLNCGCPVAKIRKKGCGSKLLSLSTTLAQIIQGIKSITTAPLSVKIRVDGDSGDRFNTDVVKAVNDAGADFLIVHGRHWTEHYDTAVRLDEIASIVHHSAIPVIGNGDVKDYPSLQKMFTTTGCAGIMIGRAGVGQPWLFQMLSAQDQGQTYCKPSTAEIGQLFLKHIQGLVELDNEIIATLQARKLSKYYFRAAGLPANLQAEFQYLPHFNALREWIGSAFLSNQNR